MVQGEGNEYRLGRDRRKGWRLEEVGGGGEGKGKGKGEVGGMMSSKLAS